MGQRFLAIAILVGTIGCGSEPAGAPVAPVASAPAAPAVKRYLLERVGDAAIVQLYADGFGSLPLREKTLIWHLYQAAIAGRDIFYDQRYVHNLEMRDVLEAILRAARPTSGAPARIEPATLDEIERYTKLFWINTGPYNNLTARKFVLECMPEAFAAAAHAAAEAGATFPVRHGESLDQLLTRMRPWFFDASVDPMVTAKTPPAGQDILTASSNNLYSGVSMKDLAGFTEMFPLNSRLVKRDGKLVEEPYRVGGRYGKAISAVVGHLEAAMPFATPPMAAALKALVTFYRSGATKDRVAYDMAWVADKNSPVDTINGFIEVYLDARGIKGSWESLVFYTNRDKTDAIQRLAREAQWF
ncbi:MAG: peptidase M49, partial [Vicinamibacterales bacterium]